MNWCLGRSHLGVILCKITAVQVFPAGGQHFSTETHQCLELPPSILWKPSRSIMLLDQANQMSLSSCLVLLVRFTAISYLTTLKDRC